MYKGLRIFSAESVEIISINMVLRRFHYSAWAIQDNLPNGNGKLISPVCVCDDRNYSGTWIWYHQPFCKLGRYCNNWGIFPDMNWKAAGAVVMILSVKLVHSIHQRRATTFSRSEAQENQTDCAKLCSSCNWLHLSGSGNWYMIKALYEQSELYFSSWISFTNDENIIPVVGVDASYISTAGWIEYLLTENL